MRILQIIKIISLLPFKQIYLTINQFKLNYKHSCIVLLHLLVIIFFRLSPTKENIILTKQFLFENLEIRTIFETKRKFVFLHEIKNNSIEFFNKKNVPDFQTIFIFGHLKQIKLFYKLMIKISRLKHFQRNLKIVLSSNPQKIQRRCFIRINMNLNTDENVLYYNLFDRCTPNSDVFFFFQKFYKTKYKLFFSFFLNNFRNMTQNTLNLALSNERESLEKFSVVIRHVMNLESHSLGFYYYLPSKGNHFSLLYVLKITAFIFLAELVYTTEPFELSLFDLLILLSTFYKPLILFVLLKNKGIKLICSVIYVFVLSFNWGILFIFLVFLKQIIKLVGYIFKLHFISFYKKMKQ